MNNIKDNTTFILTNTKLAITIALPLIAAVGFFFSLKDSVAHNQTHIETNSNEIYKLEQRMERLDDLIVENNTNIKLIQKDIEHMIDSLKEEK